MQQCLTQKAVEGCRSGFVYNFKYNSSDDKEQQGYTLRLKEVNDKGNLYNVKVTIPMNVGWIEDVYMNTLSNYGSKSFKLNFKENKDGCSIFTSDVFLETSALYKTHFTFTANGRKLYMNSDDSISNFFDYEKQAKITVNYKSPDWAKGGVMYQIFVDRFKRGQSKPMEFIQGRDRKKWNEPVRVPSNGERWNVDFYGGDLQGIIDKLNYLESLGVNILYLTPIVKSQSTNRYDASDYEEVDPYVGDKEDLKRLCDEAHKRGIKVVLDAVFNHTGDDSKYFNRNFNYGDKGAKQDPNGYYGSFYKKFIEDNELKFCYWWGFGNLPVCDGNSYNWQQYIYGEGGIIDQWFNLGIDGLRLDVADELTDNFIQNIRKAVHRNKSDGFILGEVWKFAMTEPRQYMSSGKGMDSQMNYPLADALMRYFKFADVQKTKGVIQNLLNEYPSEILNVMMNFTSTHDISRPIDIFGTDEFTYDKEYIWNPKYDNDKNPWYFNDFKITQEQYNLGKELFEAYTFCLYFMPGIISIFYGDEIGMTGIGNVINRSPYDFTKADLELLQFFRMLGKARKNEEFLKTASLNMIDINDKYIMFERNSLDGDALITVNRTADTLNFNVPPKYDKYDRAYTMKLSNSKTLNSHSGIALIRK